MAYVERRQTTGKDASGRTRCVTRYRVRYRNPGGRQHCETLLRAVDAERRRAEIELELANSAWRDPRQGDIRLDEWAASWLPTRHDLRATTWARLEGVMRKQVLPHFGRVPLNKITNGSIRRWVTELLDAGLSSATVRKAVFGLRQCLEAAVADGRLSYNPPLQIPLPSERQKPARFLSRAEVERLVQATPSRYQALVLVGAYAGLRWGEAVGLRRQDIDLTRSRIHVAHTAVELRGVITLDNPPKTTRSVRSVPVARSVMVRIGEHLETFVGEGSSDLVFTTVAGGPLFRSFGQTVLRRAVETAGLHDLTFHSLRHSFVAILVAAGCNVREVSEWAGHNSVAFTLTRYGGLFDDGTDAAVDRLDALLG